MAQFENPIYLGNPNLPMVKEFDNPLYKEPQKRAEGNEYSSADESVLHAFSDDGPEGLNKDTVDIKTKDSTKGFENNTLSFTNPCFQWGSDGLLCLIKKSYDLLNFFHFNRNNFSSLLCLRERKGILDRRKKRMS